ncbi:cytochrome c-type biogenesis protein CcmH [Rhizobiales bacterium GAS191]|jgi:cytochrome c-type biogenesis protein CcmH|nr:cytochrome c-type biogenesis protein CcmH [Rhizobiales bacterium GAS113]SED96559.1 cytochrome c-type biogenesis protein CcmH [Rhizobiales bacterium GAS188]SEE55887.1 cytochrome c-type biogenesis protein CcmH [Rhizobiales bacterium GAS191]
MMAPAAAARVDLALRLQRARPLIATILLVVLAALAGSAMGPRAAHAVEAGEMLADPKLEARARALSGEFRCLVCQNESIDESNAQLAHDLRVLIREQVGAGRSDGQVRDFLVARYGQFVLLKPRFDGETLLLWLGPFLVLAAGAVLVGFAARRRSSAVDAPLSEAERAELERLQAK